MVQTFTHLLLTWRTKTRARKRRTSDCITIVDSTRSRALKGCSRATMALKCLRIELSQQQG